MYWDSTLIILYSHRYIYPFKIRRHRNLIYFYDDFCETLYNSIASIHTFIYITRHRISTFFPKIIINILTKKVNGLTPCYTLHQFHSDMIFCTIQSNEVFGNLRSLFRCG